MSSNIDFIEEGQEEDEQEETITYYTNYNELRNPIHRNDLGRETLALHNVFGVDSSRRGNLNFIEQDVIVYISGNAVIFENIGYNKDKRFLLSLDDGGIGCVAIHPSKKIFAVGGLGYHPRIFIYEYPSMNIIKVLKDGTEKGYANMSFNRTGLQLASIGMSPDYMLTIWNWNDEIISLHSKAFSQDVFNVKFSNDNDFRLTTSGIGHIRFWKIASTFTGMKLQGDIGKFGKVELSDISSFIELPDGKVLSGTENGGLLLWEGNFIKCRFVQSNSLCHNGEITYISYDTKDKCIITTGMDGYIRWWDFNIIDPAEVDSDDSIDYIIEPLAEYNLGKGFGIKTIIDIGVFEGRRRFVFTNTNGCIISIGFYLSVTITGIIKDNEYNLIKIIQSINNNTILDQNKLVDEEIISQNHAGRITGLDTCPIGPLFASCDQIGYIQCYNYISNKLLCIRKFDSSIPSTLVWLPLSVSSSGASFIVGFNNGIVRVLKLCNNNNQTILSLQLAMKPSTNPITNISFDPLGEYLTICDNQGMIFLFYCKSWDQFSSFVPIRYFILSTVCSISNIIYCHNISWNNNANDKKILCSCNDNMIREIDLNEFTKTNENNENIYIIESSDTLDTYEVKEIPIKEHIVKVQPINPITTPAVTQSNDNVDGNTLTKENSNSLEHKNSSDSNNTSVDKEIVVIPSVPVDTTLSVYTINRKLDGIITNSIYNNTYNIYETTTNLLETSINLPIGLYNEEKLTNKPPKANIMKYSYSNRLFIQGFDDGSIVIHPNQFIELFSRSISHYNNGGVSSLAGSYDDQFVISGGYDGVITIYKIRLDTVLSSTITSELIKDIDSNIYPSISKLPLDNYVEPNYLQSIDSNKPVIFPPYSETNQMILTTIKLVESSLDNSYIDSVDLSNESYSIELSKRKNEEDLKQTSINTLKNQIKRIIKDLRAKFDFLRRQNDLLPEVVRLSRDRLMNVDGDYWDILNNEKVNILNNIHLQYKYNIEKSNQLLNKIQSKYLSNILIEEMKLYAFPIEFISVSNLLLDTNEGSNKVDRLLYHDNMIRKDLTLNMTPYVMSFRTEKLDDYILDVIEKSLNNNQPSQSNNLIETNEVINTSTNEEPSISTNLTIDLSSNPNSNSNKQVATSTTKAIKGPSNNQIRRELRQQRLINLSNHNDIKPKENEDDLRDINAIIEAEKTLGDYKLKSSDKYEITPDKISNINKKLVQIKKLKMKIFELKIKYNKKFFQLRSKKIDIYNNIKSYNKRIRDINNILYQSYYNSDLWDPVVLSNEFPDDRIEISIDEFNQYKQLRSNDKIPWKDVIPPLHSVIIGNKIVIDVNNKNNQWIIKNNSYNINENINTNNLSVHLHPNSNIIISSDQSNSSSHVLTKEYYEVDDRILIPYLLSLTDESTNELIKNQLNQLSIIIDNNIYSIQYMKQCKIYEMKLLSNDNKITNDIDISIFNQKKRLLEFERKMLCYYIYTSITSFNQSVKELNIEKHLLNNNIKLYENKLLILYYEYMILLTYESKDKQLSTKLSKIIIDKNEIINNLLDIKSKLDVKNNELTVHNNKLNVLFNELKLILPIDSNTTNAATNQQLSNTLTTNPANTSNATTNPTNNSSIIYKDILYKIYKKKIKLNKYNTTFDNSMSNASRDIDEDNEDDNAIISDSDDNDDDDDFDDVEDVCPPGCEPVLYDKIINLREKRIIIEDSISDINKAIDELKKAQDRYKSREKQINKDIQSIELEIKQFQLQKQFSLNQIPIVVPLKFNQVYSFIGSGSLTKPSEVIANTSTNISNNKTNREKEDLVKSNADNNDSTFNSEIDKLVDFNQRKLVDDIDVNSHVLFDIKTLEGLDKRILELHKECDNSRNNFKELHKERSKLKKDREILKVDITNLETKCNDLQMLKFGRIIKLDELEATADRSKEDEIEYEITQLENNNELKLNKEIKEIDKLHEQLAQVTLKNTDALKKVAQLTEEKMKLSKYLNESAPTAADELLPIDDLKEKEDRKRMITYIQLQAREIESLRAEITMLKRKDAPPLTIPTMPHPPGSRLVAEDLVLPPIHDAKSRGKSNK